MGADFDKLIASIEAGVVALKQLAVAIEELRQPLPVVNIAHCGSVTCDEALVNAVREGLIKQGRRNGGPLT